MWADVERKMKILSSEGRGTDHWLTKKQRCPQYTVYIFIVFHLSHINWIEQSYLFQKW